MILIFYLYFLPSVSNNNIFIVVYYCFVFHTYDALSCTITLYSMKVCIVRPAVTIFSIAELFCQKRQYLI